MGTRHPTDDDPVDEAERDQALLPLSGSRLALCVSGGADSMALMHLVARWAAAGRHMPEATGREGASQVFTRLPTIIVLTVDHGLRPESRAEACFVAEHAAKLGLEHRLLSGDEPAPNTGLQEWARSMRHRLILKDLAAELDEAAGFIEHRLIVMAHHQGDQAETLLMRLARGSGLGGLGGMAACQQVAVPADGVGRRPLSAMISRPLLGIPKARLVATLRAFGASWVDDTSNADPRFERVRMRNSLPVLQDVGITSQALARSAERLRQADESFRSFETRWHRDIIELHGGLHGKVSSEHAVARGRFAGVRLLARLAAMFGGAARPPDLLQLERLYDEMFVSERGFKAGTLGGCRFTLDGAGEGETHLLVCREGDGTDLEVCDLNPGCEISWDGGRFRVAARPEAPGTVKVKALGRQGWSRLKRDIPGFDDMQLLASSMWTLPAIWRGDALIAVPYFDGYLFTTMQPDKRLRAAWARYCKGAEDSFEAAFGATISVN